MKIVLQVEQKENCSFTFSDIIAMKFKYFYICLQVENIRRKHNYLPLIMELLKVLAKQGNLVPLVEKVRRSYLLLPA